MTRPTFTGKPEWVTKPFTFEEIRDALTEAWISWRTPGRVVGGSADRLKGVPDEYRDERPRKAPARMIAACMWSGDPYGENAHPDYEAKLLNALERFRAAGLLGDPEPQFAVNGRQFGPEDDLWHVVERLDG